MKSLRVVLLIAASLFVGFLSGCQESEKMSGECLKAYEQNQPLYDYVGGIPEECGE